jgi:uncharacterized protein YceK
MGKIAIICWLLVAALGGCGTVANLNPQGTLPLVDIPELCNEHTEIYGGVKCDLRSARVNFHDGMTELVAEGKLTRLCLIVPACCLDLPLSLLADTLTLPVAVVSKNTNSKE